MNSSEAEHLNKDIVKAAASIAQDWPGVTTAEDLGQEVWLRISRLTTARQQSLINLPSGARMSQLRKWCRQAASEERDKYEILTGNYHYSVSEVREMLESGWLLHRPDNNYAEDGRTSESYYDEETDSYVVTNIPSINLGSLNLTDAHTDLMNGIMRLKINSSGYHEALGVRYVSGLTPSNGAAERKLQRAVDALTREMNRSWNVRVDDFQGVSTNNKRWRR